MSSQIENPGKITCKCTQIYVSANRYNVVHVSSFSLVDLNKNLVVSTGKWQEGLEVAIISTSNSRDIIGARMQMLGISRYYAGPQDKLDVLESWMQELDIEKDSIAFVGDDLNDKTIMEYVGLAACPQDAVEEIKLLVDVVLSKKGGEGCVREFIDRFILSTED